MATEQDNLKDFNDAYEQAFQFWNDYLLQAKEDMKAYVGNQWSSNELSYLAGEQREAFVFNKIYRVIKLVEGYQRKNRLALTVNAVEGSDEATASLWTAAVMWQMQVSNLYNVMSDAFSGGPLKTGFNLINLYMDFKDDPLNGDIRGRRVPYNRFLVDPVMSERDFSDINYLTRREWLTKDSIKGLLPPNSRKVVEDISPKGTIDEKYMFSTISPFPFTQIKGKELLRYDEFYVKELENYTILVDSRNGRTADYNGPKDRLKNILQLSPELRPIEGTRHVAKLKIFVDDVQVFDGDEPTGTKEFPFIPLIGNFDPEEETSQWRVRSLVRGMRDPQKAYNRQSSQQIDMVESKLNSGWIAEEESVVDPASLYLTGQGKVVWTKKGAKMAPQQIQPPEIPASMFQLKNDIDKDIFEIPGANEELLGSTESGADIAGILAKLRSGAGLTILQDLFDNQRLAKKILGNRLIKIMQENYTPAKIMRITGKQPTKEFYNGKFGKYDAVPAEGILTDSQKELYSAQLFAFKQAGAPIPWSEIIRKSTLTNKEDLAKVVAQQEQAEAQAQQLAAQDAAVNRQLLQAETARLVADALKKRTESQENLSDITLNRARAIKDFGEADINAALQVLNFLRQEQQVQ